MQNEIKSFTTGIKSCIVLYGEQKERAVEILKRLGKYDEEKDLITISATMLNSDLKENEYQIGIHKRTREQIISDTIDSYAVSQYSSARLEERLELGKATVEYR